MMCDEIDIGTNVSEDEDDVFDDDSDSFLTTQLVMKLYFYTQTPSLSLFD
jgi:hypothetical protein